MTHPVIVIAGPTATGKTSYAVALAKALGGVVLSADSRLVYQGLSIGTAKPTTAEQQGIPHFMMDVCPPTDTYTVARYVEDARPLLDDLIQQQPVLIVGGTGLYIKQLLTPQTVPSVPPDPAFRLTLATLDDVTLHQQLQQQDPRRAAQIHPHNRVRVLRALEIIHHTGQPIPDNATSQTALPYTIHWFGLTVANRDAHRQWIADRVHAMVALGWLDEVNMLRQQWGDDANALHITHGYPEWLAHLQGKLSYEDALTQTIIQVRQYARRQRTWFHHHAPHMAWTAVDKTSMPSCLDHWLNTVK
jgi:tRNA dimethylallyltransferase